MEGKVCLITGANGSIGKYTALGLAQRGATVVVVCRNRAKGEAVQAEIKFITRTPLSVLTLACLLSTPERSRSQA
jgi:NAD(P)-dependent dehydrogenase (short-subunit alcohol dehydrogenase family)